jgi:sporulation protein YlmC with PRC-barrel domain
MEDIRTWRGSTLVDRDGDKIGKVEDVYLDRSSDEPEWIAVKTGLFGSNVSFVPIHDAAAAGDDVRVPYEKRQVKDAPNIDPDGELSPEEERRLYQHYGRSDYDEWTATPRIAARRPTAPAQATTSTGASTTATPARPAATAPARRPTTR